MCFIHNFNQVILSARVCTHPPTHTHTHTHTLTTVQVAEIFMNLRAGREAWMNNVFLIFIINCWSYNGIDSITGTASEKHCSLKIYP